MAWFRMGWNIESMTGVFRPITGWMPKKMVPLMPPADVPHVLVRFGPDGLSTHIQSCFDL